MRDYFQEVIGLCNLDNNTFLHMQRTCIVPSVESKQCFFKHCVTFFYFWFADGLMFIYHVAFIGVWGSYWDQRHSGSHRFAWWVEHCRRLLIKTLTGREEWTFAEKRQMTIG